MSLAGDVELEVPEAVDVEHRRADAAVARSPAPAGRCGRASPGRPRRRARRSARRPRGARRPARRRRGAWNVRETVLEVVARVGQARRAARPARRSAASVEQAVVGADVDPAVAVRIATARRSPPTPGSTTARCTPGGMYGTRAGEHERALRHRLRRDPVGDVDDLRVAARSASSRRGRRPTKSSWSAEVGEERDVLYVACLPAPRRVRRRVDRDEPVEVVRLGLDGDRQPDRARRRGVVSGPIDDRRRLAADPGVRAWRPSRTRARRRRPRAGRAASRLRRVERRRSRRRARSIGPRRELRAAREEHLALGLRELGEQAVLAIETVGDERPARSRARAASRPCPARPPRPSGGCAARRATSSAPFGLVTIAHS